MPRDLLQNYNLPNNEHYKSPYSNNYRYETKWREQAQYLNAANADPKTLSASQFSASYRANQDLDFFSRVANLQDDIKKYKQTVDDLGKLQMTKLKTRDPTMKTDTLAKDENKLRKYLLASSKRLKNELKELQNESASSRRDSPDFPIQQQQLQVLQTLLKQAFQQFMTTEQHVKQEAKKRIERQLYLINPNAAPSDIQQVIDNGADQLFVQDLLQSSAQRLNNAQSTLRAVQERQQDLERLETTMLDVAQLITDMNDIVLEQDAQVVQIEANATSVIDNTQAGEKQIQGAVSKARRSRKLKICCAVTLLILIIIVVVIIIKVVNN